MIYILLQVYTTASFSDTAFKIWFIFDENLMISKYQIQIYSKFKQQCYFLHDLYQASLFPNAIKHVYEIIIKMHISIM